MTHFKAYLTMNTLNEKNNERLKVLLTYFSATGNTKKVVKTVEEKLIERNVAVTMLDITSHQSRHQQISLSEYDGVMFGFPIYSLRAPRVCREWLETLEGKGMKSSVFFTYGGFGKEPAHFYMKALLERRNFILVSTAEIVGAHTFNLSGWKAVEGRPNQADLNVVEDYAVKTLQRFANTDAGTMSNFEKPQFTSEQLDQFEKYRFQLITQPPTREGKACSMCMLCETLCPTQAMDARTGMADKASCIACFRCIANCPDDVLHTNDISDGWETKLKLHDTTEEALDQLESRIFL